MTKHFKKGDLLIVNSWHKRYPNDLCICLGLDGNVYGLVRYFVYNMRIGKEIRLFTSSFEKVKKAGK